MLKGIHALIIEDELFDAQVLGNLMEIHNMQYTVVNHGSEALTTLHALADIGVIFLDLDLPGVNGFDLIEQLQAEGYDQQVPIVAYTSHLNEMHNVQQAGFHSCLTKPVDGERFAINLQRILAGEPVWE